MPVNIYSRYHGIPTVESRGKISLQQRLMQYQPQSEGITHTIVGGETLDQIANHYYGRPDLWWRIADANPPRFPLNWRAGDTLVIPPIAEATRTPRR